jgi:hypothetical protein
MPPISSSVSSLFLRSSSNCLRLLPRLPIIFILPSIFPWITYFRRQFLRKMWPIQLAPLIFIERRIFLSFLTLCHSFSFFARSVYLVFSILLQHHTSKVSRNFWYIFRTVQVSAPHKGGLEMHPYTGFFLNFKSNLLVKWIFFFNNNSKFW